jgi:ATP-dependent protease HslVU (ClpYQ) ATPase subunit
MKLNGVSFNKKTTPHVKEIGFIAQEVEEIIPDLVTETSDGIKTVAYSRVSAILVETIKEQQTQITELKEMVNILTKKINDL